MKYETAVAIGRGASGQVFKAWDPEAQRFVALKVFADDEENGDARERAERRRREAEAQSHLDHPSICEIYEVGTTRAGRGFLAMRFVDGEPLDQVAARLPLRSRVELVRQIADAVACAHQAGIIHRDLKPANLLVEEQPDGSLRAFVLDFGIVRLEDQKRLTETGRLLGTPGYVSPEQALGTAEVNARSDVFSLGVVLYQVLTGELPFAADSNVGALIRALEHDPPLAHRRFPELPRELSHIAHKALEKDPKRRYADAGALRRDLDRYLAAGQVSARGVGWFGRWLRRVERRPMPWLLGALFFFVALCAAGWSVRNRLVEQQQGRAAERFARRSAEIESQLRFLEMLPKRPPARRRERLFEALQSLEADVARASGRARAAGEYAVGRSLLALGRSGEAIAHLERARELGFDDPAGALALGRALLDQARSELREVDLLRDPEVRAAERHRVREQLRRDALPFLEEAAAAETLDSGRTLARALAALLLDQHDDAQRLAEAVTDSSPWLYEADLIRADVQRDLATQHRLLDEPDRAAAALVAEAEILAAAVEKAPSAPTLRLRQCENQLISSAVDRPGSDAQTLWDHHGSAAVAACQVALELLPSSREARRLLVEIRWRRGLERLRWQGADAALEDVEQAVLEARSLVAGSEASQEIDAEVSAEIGAEDRLNLGNALYAKARVMYELRQPPDDLLKVYQEAAANLEAGLRRAPGRALGWQSLGNVWTGHGSVLDLHGRDPRPSYALATSAYRQGLRGGSEPHHSRLYNGICLAQSEAAYYGVQHPEASGVEAVDTALQEAKTACGLALERDPDYLSALSNLGLVYWTEVEWRVVGNRSPTDAAEQGLAVFGRLLELAPDHVSGRNNLAGMVAAEVSWHLDDSTAAGIRPGLEALLLRIREAEKAIKPLVERYPVDASLHLAHLKTLAADIFCRREEAAKKGAPEIDAAWSEARAAVASLDSAGAASKVTAVRRAEFHRRAARCAIDRGRLTEVQNEIAKGLAAADQSLAIDPDYAEAVSERDELIRLGEVSGASLGPSQPPL